MQAKLISGYETGRMREVCIAREATIGKDSANSIVLSLKNISRRHARIFFDDAEKSYVLEDLNSRNGTRLDGERVRGKERLENVHVITFGNQFDCFFQVVKSGAESTDPEYIETKPVQQNQNTVVEDDFCGLQNANTVFDDEFVGTPKGLVENGENKSKDDQVVGIASPDSFLSDVESAPTPIASVSAAFAEVDMTSPFALTIDGAGETHRLKQGKNIIGRTDHCDIAINHHTISRRHACISIQNDKIRIHDLNSKNHTFVGRRKILEVTEIPSHTLLRFGEVAAILKKV
jgi:pSer/pThr/pTyr-binding forkhead associated (FHA) protein